MERSDMEHGSEANPGKSPTPSEARGNAQKKGSRYKVQGTRENTLTLHLAPCTFFLYLCRLIEKTSLN
jgi:hypothetical protein